MARNSIHKILLPALFLGFLAQSAVAKITIQANLGGDLGVANGTVGVLVVDRGGNGFQSPLHSSVEGTRLAAGEQIGLSDDIIIGVLQSSSAPFSGGGGFTGVLRGIDYNALQLTQNMQMAFYWFPGVTTPGASLNGNNFETFRTNNAPTINRAGVNGTLASALTWQLPGPRGLFNLVYLDAGNGGGISIGNPGAGGDHSNGTTGTDTSVLPGGGNSPVDEATNSGGNQTLVDVDWSEAARGSYQGLITRGGGARVDGEVFVSLSVGGRFTARVVVDGVSFSSFGQLTPQGDIGPILISRTGQPPVNLTLNLRQDSSTNAYTLVGTVDNDGTPGNVEATQNAYQRERRFVDEAGSYTFALPAPGGVGQTALPAGDGIGRLSVTQTGTVLALMTLGDGVIAIDTGNLSEDGIYHLFSSLYGNRGFLAGRVTFRNIDNVADVDGQLHWVKQAETLPTPNSTYPLGFETSVNLVGSKYTPPRRGTTILWQFADGPNNVMLNLLGGQLDPAFTAKNLTWDMNNSVSFPGAQQGESLRVSALSFSGTVRGSYQRSYVDGNGANQTQRVSFIGVALQKQGLITGHFIGNNNLTGIAKIESTGAPGIVVQDAGGGNIVNGGTLDFGNIGVDGGVGEKIVEIQNGGAGVLYLTSTPTVDDPAFGVSSGRWGYLQPGERVRLRVRFDPSAIQAYAATLTILSNDRMANPYLVNLTGAGVAGSASDIDSGISRNHVETPGTSAAPSDFSNNPRFDADPTGASGAYSGRIWTPDVIGATVGEASFRITGNATSGTGLFSGLIKVGSSTAFVIGNVAADGTVNVTTFAGLLASEYTLSSLNFVSNGSSEFALSGTLTRNSDGEVINVVAVHNGYNSTTNKTSWAGTYTMVIPGNEDLGEGYPSGDSVATVRVGNNGQILALVSLADGQIVSLLSTLTSDDRWNIFHSSLNGVLGGQITFRDVPNVSDFDGSLRWTRFANANAQRFHEGFILEGAAIGSRFVTPSRGRRLISQLPDGADNAVMELSGLTPAVGQRNVNWTSGNRLIVTPGNGTEFINVTALSSSGGVIGNFLDRFDDNGTQRTRAIPMRGVVFQKQGITTGHWYYQTNAGHFGISPTGQPTLVVSNAAGGAIAAASTINFGNVGVDGGTGERVVVIQNTGPGMLFIPRSPEISGPNADQFYLAREHAGYLAPGGTMAIRIGFNPSAIAAATATLTLINNDRSNNPFTLTLNGTGAAGGASDLEANLGSATVNAPTPAAAPASVDVAYDPNTATGLFNGVISNIGGAESVIGTVSQFVSGNPITGTGFLSLSMRVNGRFISAIGAVAADGSVSTTSITSGFALNGFHVVDTAGVIGYAGQLEDLNSGNTYNLQLGAPGYNFANQTTLEGKYTVVVPAPENLGEGYPSGDSVGTASVLSSGSVLMLLGLADGSVASSFGNLDGNDTMRFYINAVSNNLSGSIVFRDLAGVSDADGPVVWSRSANINASDFQEGFNIETSMLLSAYNPVAGQALLTGLTQDGNPNATLSLTDNYNPLTGAAASTFGPYNIVWSDQNRVTYTAVGNERVLMTVLSFNGSIIGSVFDPGTNRSYNLRAVVFQKQNIVPGHYKAPLGPSGRAVVAPNP